MNLFWKSNFLASSIIWNFSRDSLLYPSCLYVYLSDSYTINRVGDYCHQNLKPLSSEKTNLEKDCSWTYLPLRRFSHSQSFRFPTSDSLNPDSPDKYVLQFSFLPFSPTTNELQDGCVSGNHSLNEYLQFALTNSVNFSWFSFMKSWFGFVLFCWYR